MDLARMRREYGEQGLTEADLAPDWPTQFAHWFDAVLAAELPEPNAMIVATASPSGQPSARTVLLKGYDDAGFVFFTNYESRKGTELAENPRASIVFPWFPIGRQVVVVGAAEKIERAATEEYFAKRPRDSALGSWASPQSTVLAGRAELEALWDGVRDRFEGDVPAPPHWGGFRVVPETVEFWQGRHGRLHDRLRYRHTADGRWVVERLAP